MPERDFSIRVPTSEKRLAVLEQRCVAKRDLTPIMDIMFKPKGVDLADFHPGKTCVRLREFPAEEKPSTLVALKTVKAESGYSDERQKLGEGETKELVSRAEAMGYEEWGRMKTKSTQFDLEFGENSAQVLSQQIDPVGGFLKIESPNQPGLREALELLSASEGEKISKNAAVLLAEKMGLV